MTSAVCHNVTPRVTNDVTRCVQSQSQNQTQNQSPFLYLKVRFWPNSLASEVQTAREESEE